MLQNYWKFPNLYVQTFGLVHHDTKWSKSWSSMEDPVVPLERNLYGRPLAGQFWERQLEKVLSKYGWEKVPNFECLFVHREKGLFLSVYMDDITLAGKKQNIDPMWKVLNKEVDLGEPTSFPRSCKHWCVLKDNAKQAKILWTITEPCLNHEFPRAELKSLPYSKNFRISSWSFDMEDHAKKCVERCCELTTIWMRISTYGVVEVFIDFTEEFKYTETNPMCSIHWSLGTSY